MVLESLPLLSLLLWIPILGGLGVVAVGRGEHPDRARALALAVAVVTLLLSIPLYTGFDTSTHAMQFVERAPWIERFGIDYHLGVDGISMPLILLTTFSTVLVLLSAWKTIQHRVAQYLASFLVMEGLMVGVFSALDAVLFYVLWEAMLVPMFLIIGVWGGTRRIYATVKFFLYTFLGSVLMLVALLYLYSRGGSFAIPDLHVLPLDLTAQTLVFLAFLVAFGVKVPMWPVHTWLPDAHVEAPTGGSVILAAIMLKMGGYGFLRFSLPITPDASRELDWLVIGLSLVAIVYIGFVAIIQTDLKKLIAYSSISHMGFVTLGFFLAFEVVAKTGSIAGATLGIEGGMVQMISHGFISGALFFSVGVLYDRLHTREIAAYGGVVNTMPTFAALMMLFVMANSGLPGTSGFVGEFLVVLASFQANFWYAFLAGTTLLLGAAYNLWMYKRVIYGRVANEGVAALQDLDRREFWILASLAALVLLFGVWPNPLLEVMHPSVEHLVQQVLQSKL